MKVYMLLYVIIVQVKGIMYTYMMYMYNKICTQYTCTRPGHPLCQFYSPMMLPDFTNIYFHLHYYATNQIANNTMNLILAALHCAFVQVLYFSTTYFSIVISIPSFFISTSTEHFDTMTISLN